MQKIIIKTDNRDAVGKANVLMREQGMIPAVVYGHNYKSRNLSLNSKEFNRIFHEVGHSKIISLQDNKGDDTPVLIHEVQMHPTSNQPIHVDFYKVKMDEKIKANVPLHFIGESSAVYEKAGSFITNTEEVEVETLPANLPSNVEVDISVLDDFDKSIHVSDLKIPEGVEILTDPETLIAKVEPPRSDEEMAELEEEVGEAVPEGVNEGEETVGEEGGEEQPVAGEGGEAEAKSESSEKSSEEPKPTQE